MTTSTVSDYRNVSEHIKIILREITANELKTLHYYFGPRIRSGTIYLTRLTNSKKKMKMLT